MAKWEYLEVNLHRAQEIGGYIDQNGKRENIEKGQVNAWYRSSVECANHFGELHWELIKMGFDSWDGGSSKWFFFKRSKS